MKIESKEFEEYIRSAVISISNGLAGTGFRVLKPIEFNLAVTNTAEGEGGLKIYVAKVGGKLKSEEISHIKFEAHPEPKKATVYHPAFIDNSPKW